MKFKIKLKVKFVLMNLLGLATLVSILVIAYFYKRLIETSITICAFYYFRSKYDKQYHASSLFLCSFISIIVFVIVIQLETRMAISLLFSIILSFIITLISYKVKVSQENENLVLKYNEFKREKQQRCLENLTENEMLEIMPSINKDTIHIVYGYLHKGRGVNASNYAYKVHISEATLYRYLKQIKNCYESLG